MPARTLTSLAIIPCLAAALSGCVFRSINPQPAAARGHSLADLAGSYRLAREPDRQPGESNVDTFGFLGATERRKGDIMHLASGAGTLTIRYHASSGSIERGTVSLTSDGVSLRDGGLTIRHRTASGAPILPGPVLSSGRATDCYLADDGDLIVATRTWETAAPLIVLPFHEAQRRVYHFERIHP